MAEPGLNMPLNDVEILRQALIWARAGLGVALATVIETFGSAPRPVGSHLAVAANGDFCGSVSAGCVEGEVITAAQDAIADGAPRLLDFGVADETAWRVGLSCGGRIRVHVARLDADSLTLLSLVLEEIAARRACALATPLAGGPTRLLRAGEEASADAFVNVYRPAPRLAIVGAVHVAQALAPMASLAGFDVVVVDPRGVYATPERFPGARLDLRWPDEALADMGLDAFTGVAVLTHDPKIDDPALRLALASTCFYIGALGSRATHARRVERLLASGAPHGALERLRAPIGLDIAAVSPAEIAVSILSELILARDQKPLRGDAGANRR